MKTAFVLLTTRMGMTIKFSPEQVRAMGRTAGGIVGIHLQKEDSVVNLSAVEREEGCNLLTVSEGGFGKCTAVKEFRSQTRGGRGVMSFKITDKTGMVMAAHPTYAGDEVLLISAAGQLIRFGIEGMRKLGRKTTGVKLIQLERGDFVTGVQIIRPAAIQEEEK